MRKWTARLINAQKIWKDTAPEQMLHVIWCGNGQLKPQWATTTHLRMATIQQRQRQTSVRTGSHGNSHSLLVGMPNGTAPLKDSLDVLWNWTHSYPAHTSQQALSLVFNPNDLDIYIQTKPGPYPFIAALFLTAKTWKPSKCPCIGERVNKPRSLRMMDCYSEITRNELSAMKSHGGALNAYFQVKEDNLKSLCSASHSLSLWQRQKCGHRDRSVVPGAGGG